MLVNQNNKGFVNSVEVNASLIALKKKINSLERKINSLTGGGSSDIPSPIDTHSIINDDEVSTDSVFSSAKTIEEIETQLSFNYPDWENKVQREAVTVYIAEEDGWVLNTGVGPYTENVWIDMSNDDGVTWTRITAWYDDINSNTKGSNALVPVRKGDYYRGSGPENEGYRYWFIPKRKN